MPQIRALYHSGSAVVVNIPKTYREMMRVEPGDSVRVELYTPRMLLEEFGVTNAIIEQLVLREEHFVIIDKHRE